MKILMISASTHGDISSVPMLNHYAAHLEDDKVVDLARNVMKKVFIEQKEDEETINMLNQKLEELNKVSA